MSDTEEVVLRRKPKNTKPEVAREKLKEKRERLKKEKDNVLIEEAKKRLIAEQEAKLVDEQKKAEAAKADPMTLMMRRMEEMMASMNKPKEEIPVVKPKVSRKKKEVEVVYAEEAKSIPKQKQPRKKKVVYDTIDSPSNIFVGNPNSNIQERQQEQEQEQQEQEQYHTEQSYGNPLLNALASKRNMSAWY